MLSRLFLIGSLCCLAQAHAEPVLRWVSGSYVNVRSMASKKSDVLDRLLINTQVSVLSQNNDFCEITWNENKHGFVACNLLSEKALSVTDVEMATLDGGKPNPNYSVARAFWLQPTFNRFLEMGRFLDSTMVPDKQKKIEEDYAARGDWVSPSPEIKRSAVPEFDEMKKLLAKGVIAPKELAQKAEKWNNKKPGLLPNGSAQLWAYEQIHLPPVKPSFFKSADDLASPKISPEKISAQYGIPWTLTVNDSAGWTGDSNSGPSRSGIWNMGRVTQRLLQKTYIYAIRNRNAVESMLDEVEYEVVPGSSDGHCEANYRRINSPKNIALHELESDQIFPLFRTAQAISFKHAKVSSARQVLEQPQYLGVDPKFIRATTTFVDVDGDGNKDIALWHGINTQPGLGDNAEYSMKIIFVNISGAWHLLDYDEDEIVCGC